VPDWKLYVNICSKEDLSDPVYWEHFTKQRMEDPASVSQTAEAALNVLRNEFELPTEEEVFEEFDGINQDEARAFVLVVNLPVLVRSHALDVRLNEDFVKVYLY
jgi:hypothetical protein